MWPAKLRQLHLASQVDKAKPCLRSICVRSLDLQVQSRFIVGMTRGALLPSWCHTSQWRSKSGRLFGISSTSFPFCSVEMDGPHALLLSVLVVHQLWAPWFCFLPAVMVL